MYLYCFSISISWVFRYFFRGIGSSVCTEMAQLIKQRSVYWVEETQNQGNWKLYTISKLSHGNLISHNVLELKQVFQTCVVSFSKKLFIFAAHSSPDASSTPVVQYHRFRINGILEIDSLASN